MESQNWPIVSYAQVYGTLASSVQHPIDHSEIETNLSFPKHLKTVWFKCIWLHCDTNCEKERVAYSEVSNRAHFVYTQDAPGCWLSGSSLSCLIPGPVWNFLYGQIPVTFELMLCILFKGNFGVTNIVPMDLLVSRLWKTGVSLHGRVIANDLYNTCFAGDSKMKLHIQWPIAKTEFFAKGNLLITVVWAVHWCCCTLQKLQSLQNNPTTSDQQ